MAPTANRSRPVLLDVTRLTSRVGTGPLTGVDRVEFAYLEWCLYSAPEFMCLAKVAGGYVLLDRDGASMFRDKLLGRVPWGSRDLRAKIGIRTPTPRARAESDLRGIAVARTNNSGLIKFGSILAGKSFAYLNVGHSNIADAVFQTLSSIGCKSVVMVHDLIPLTHPEFQRPGTVKKFETRMRVVAVRADIVITNSTYTAGSVRKQFKEWGSQPHIVASHLGLHVENPNCVVKYSNNRPYFVILGTIEPRKNHALLLDVWEALGKELDQSEIPSLHIVGRRGWKNEDVFSRLDDLVGNGAITEHNDMSDQELWSLLQGAHALLFPSFAEGFGLPSLEAVNLGIPVICGDLAIHHELLGEYPVYADLHDPYLWKKTIVEMASKRQEISPVSSRPPIPTWADHFERVNKSLIELD